MKERKILVVDDEELIRDLYEDSFATGGYAVRAAKSAEEALEILKDEKYWVMFLDLGLPGMNGVDLGRKIKRDYPLAIIYAITGFTSLFELSECREAGFEDYFSKPVDLTLLLQAAQYAFEKMDRWRKN